MNNKLCSRGFGCSVGAYRAAILAAAFAAVTLGFANQVSAGGAEVPPGCNFAGAGASMTRFPATNVVHGQEVCYRVQYSNGAPGVNCEIRNFDADLVLPNGTSIPMFAAVTILSGEVVTCPAATLGA